MNRFPIAVDTIAAVIGAAVGFMYGQVTGLFWALVAFMVLDYVTGVMIAIISKKLSSETGFKGLCKKFLILIFVAVGHIVDTYVLNGAAVLMTAILLFYIANEGISIVENAANLGLPVPQKLKDILEQIKSESEDDKNDKND